MKSINYILRIGFISVLSFVVLPSVAQQKLPQENDLRIISYNIHHGEGLDGKTDYKRIGQMIRNLQADIVALQEIDSVTGRSGHKDVLQEIANEALMYPVFTRAIAYDGGAYGIGLLSKTHPLQIKQFPLPGKEEPRVLLLAEFEEFWIGCTHLSLTPEDQLASLPIIRQFASGIKKPFLLAGDWNALPNDATIREIQKDFVLLNDTEQPTYPADKPKQLLDYIAVWKNTGKYILKKNFSVIPDMQSSDHRPIMAKIRFLQPADRLFYSEPYLQSPTADGITVMFQTRAIAHCWIEYGTDTLNLKKVQALQNGQAVCDIENKVRLSGLKPATSYYYRLCAREIGDYQAYSKSFGDTVRTSFFSFRLPETNEQDFTAIILNDMHGYGETEKALAEVSKQIRPDFVVFNGDCLPEPASREEAMENINRLARLFNASSLPVFFVRGNHEIRNAYSVGMNSLIDYPDGKTYSAFSWGDTRFIILDCGEDKEDTHKVYAGLNDFSGFREEQTLFLQEELNSKPFKKAKRHILINHIPLWGNYDKYTPCPEMWGPLLKKAQIDINLSAHTHRYAFHPKGSELGNPFPVYIGGGYRLDKATYGILQKKGNTLTFTVENLKGEVLKSIQL